MWDRILGASSSSGTATAMAAAPGELVGDARLLLRAGAGTQKQRLPRMRGAIRGARRADLDLDLDLGPGRNALGISLEPARYEIRGGKVVPQLARHDVNDLPRRDVEPAYSREPPRQSSRSPPQQPSQHPSQHQQRRQRGGALGSHPVNTRDEPAHDIYASTAMPQYELVSGGLYDYGQAAEEQVSPPTSPLGYAEHGNMPDDVSPIDEPMPFRSKQDAHAPRIPYHHRTSDEVAWVAANQPWAHGPTLPPLDGRGHEDGTKRIRRPDEASRSHVSGAAASAARRPTRVPPAVLAQRTRLVAQKPEPVEAAARPPSKAVGGRSEMLSPVHGDLHVAPLNIPRKSAPRAGAPPMTSEPAAARWHDSETSSDAAMTTPARAAKPLTSSQGPGGVSPSGPPQPRGSYPSPPASETCAPPPAPSWHSPPLPSLVKKKPAINADAIAKIRAPTLSRREQNFAADARGTTKCTTKGTTGGPKVDDGSASTEAWSQPPSRFSVTTCATSTPGTPRQPALDSHHPVPALTRRPVPSAQDRARSPPGKLGSRAASDEADISLLGLLHSTFDPSKSPTARPRDGVSRARAAMDNAKLTDGGGGSWAVPVTKPLPPSPPELSSSNSRIAQLNVQMHSLLHRRINLSRSIQQMTELMPSDSLFASDEVLRRRETEKRKVQALKDELAEVQREEYDLGLKLYRANKRQERNDEFEQSTLWVRKVSG